MIMCSNNDIYIKTVSAVQWKLLKQNQLLVNAEMVLIWGIIEKDKSCIYFKGLSELN